MSTVIKGAATGIQIKSPPRLDTSRCTNNNNSAPAFKQSLPDIKAPLVKKSEGDRMNQELVAKREQEFAIIEQVVMQGDLSKLSPEQRVTYYHKVCASSGLNPLTNPFSYIQLQGKLTLYAKKDCTEQLRKIHGVSIDSLDDKLVDDIYIVTALAKDKTGRIDQAKGAVSIANLKGEAKANAIMKAETKAKRRVTLSICGLGWTDESEIDSIPNAIVVDVDLSTGEIKSQNGQMGQNVELLALKAPETPLKTPIDATKTMSAAQVEELEMILGDCDEKYRDNFYDRLNKAFKTSNLAEISANMFEGIKSSALNAMKLTIAQTTTAEVK